MRPWFSRSIFRVAAFAAASAATAQPASADEFALGHVDVRELKSAYLWCDRASTRARLPTALIARCSVIHEELKRRAFDGDSEKLLAWWRSQAAALGYQAGDRD